MIIQSNNIIHLFQRVINYIIATMMRLLLCSKLVHKSIS